MILRSVAFDAEKKATGFFGIDNRKINSEARGPDLPLNHIAAAL